VSGTQVGLRPHPDGGPTPLEGIAVEATRLAGARLRLRYLASGDMSRLHVPGPTPQARVDELWRHTCFEAFLSLGDDRYWEFNLAPSSQWAAYAFAGYRERTGDPEVAAPVIHTEAAARTLALAADLDLSAIAGLDPDAPWTLGLSAVVEDISGERSYWALAHAPSKPDFHHASAFALHLPSPDRP
jgi:hypothetical protein